MNPETTAILHTMITDQLRFELRCYFGTFGGRRIGAVAATINAGYDTFALNDREFQRVLTALREHRLEDAYVFGARLNGTARPEFMGAKGAEEVAEFVRNRPTHGGRFGHFHTLPLGYFSGEEVPF